MFQRWRDVSLLGDVKLRALTLGLHFHCSSHFHSGTEVCTSLWQNCHLPHGPKAQNFVCSSGCSLAQCLTHRECFRNTGWIIQLRPIQKPHTHFIQGSSSYLFFSKGKGFLVVFSLGFGTWINNYKIIICLIEQVGISSKYIALPKCEKTSAFNIAYKIKPLHKKWHVMRKSIIQYLRAKVWT